MDNDKSTKVVKKSKQSSKNITNKTKKVVTKKADSKTSTKSDKIKKVIITKKVNTPIKKETIIKKDVSLEEKTEAISSIIAKKEHKTLKLIFDIIFWILISVLAFVWITDFIRVRNEKEPKFCLSKYEETFDDGTVNVCRGFGYNVYEYNRMSVDIKTAFCPFFIKMKK